MTLRPPSVENMTGVCFKRPEEARKICRFWRFDYVVRFAEYQTAGTESLCFFSQEIAS